MTPLIYEGSSSEKTPRIQMELDSRKNEVKEEFKRQDISIEVGDRHMNHSVHS